MGAAACHATLNGWENCGWGHVRRSQDARVRAEGLARRAAELCGGLALVSGPFTPADTSVHGRPPTAAIRWQCFVLRGRIRRR